MAGSPSSTSFISRWKRSSSSRFIGALSFFSMNAMLLPILTFLAPWERKECSELRPGSVHFSSTW